MGVLDGWLQYEFDKKPYDFVQERYCGIVRKSRDAASGSVQRKVIICRRSEAEKSSGEIDSSIMRNWKNRHDAKALERFRRPAYQSVSVAEYLAKKYDITAEVDTSADRRKRNDGK